MKTIDDALAFADTFDKPANKHMSIVMLAAEVRRLQEENERLRVQLAGCGVAAMQNTADSREHRIEKGAYGWSASYADVCSAVDREIVVREENERLKADAERYRWLRDAGATFYTGGPEITDGSDKVHVCEFAMDAAIDAARGGK